MYSLGAKGAFAEFAKVYNPLILSPPLVAALIEL